MYFINALGLPITPYKKKGIETGNHISNALAQAHLSGWFNPLLNRVVIQNSSTLTKEVVHNILYQRPHAFNYRIFYPYLEGQDEEGNWLFNLQKVKPPISPYIPPPGYISQYNLPDDFKKARRVVLPKIIFPDHELKDAKDELAFLVMSGMSELMKENEGMSGCWYKNDFADRFPSITLKDELDPNYFIKTGTHEFELIEGKKPSDAIKCIFKGPSMIDCGMAVSICYLNALLKFVGEEKFDAYFTDNPTGKLMIEIRQIGNRSLLPHFSRYTKPSRLCREGTENNRPLEPGDVAGFLGVNFYGIKHPEGAGQAWNVIYAGRNQEGIQVFLAFGFEKPLTEKEIIEQLIKEYNQERSLHDLLKILKNSNEDYFKYFDPLRQPLKQFYTIQKEDIEKYSIDAFLDGYYPTITARLEPKYALLLKKSPNIELLREDLDLRNRFSLLSPIDAITNGAF